MVREGVRERGELPDRVTYIQHCLESQTERERERECVMKKTSRNGKRDDEIAGKKNEKEGRCRNKEKVEAENET